MIGLKFMKYFAGLAKVEEDCYTNTSQQEEGSNAGRL